MEVHLQLEETKEVQVVQLEADNKVLAVLSQQELEVVKEVLVVHLELEPAKEVSKEVLAVHSKQELAVHSKQELVLHSEQELEAAKVLLAVDLEQE